MKWIHISVYKSVLFRVKKCCLMKLLGKLLGFDLIENKEYRIKKNIFNK